MANSAGVFLAIFYQLDKHLFNQLNRRGRSNGKFGRYGVGFTFFGFSFVDDPGIGFFLRRDGQTEEYFEHLDAMFYYRLRIKHPVGIDRL